MDKEKRERTPRAPGKAAAGQSGGENVPPVAKRRKEAREYPPQVSESESGGEGDLESEVDASIVRGNSSLIEILIEKVTSLERAAETAMEKKATEQGMW